MRVARVTVVSADQQEILGSCARARSAPARNVERAWIVVLAGAGLQDQQIATALQSTPDSWHYSQIVGKVELHAH